MPKLKTNKAAAKRFKVTATGKIKFPRANKQHILGEKSPKRKRKLRKLGVLNKTETRRIKEMLPYA